MISSNDFIQYIAKYSPKKNLYRFWAKNRSKKKRCSPLDKNLYHHHRETGRAYPAGIVTWACRNTFCLWEVCPCHMPLMPQGKPPPVSQCTEHQCKLDNRKNDGLILGSGLYDRRTVNDNKTALPQLWLRTKCAHLGLEVNMLEAIWMLNFAGKGLNLVN
jgi:hypothetical protein